MRVPQGWSLSREKTHPEESHTLLFTPRRDDEWRKQVFVLVFPSPRARNTRIRSTSDFFYHLRDFISFFPLAVSVERSTGLNPERASINRGSVEGGCTLGDKTVRLSVWLFITAKTPNTIGNKQLTANRHIGR